MSSTYVRQGQRWDCPDYDDWLSRPEWTAEDAAYLLCGIAPDYDCKAGVSSDAPREMVNEPPLDHQISRSMKEAQLVVAIEGDYDEEGNLVSPPCLFPLRTEPEIAPDITGTETLEVRDPNVPKDAPKDVPRFKVVTVRRTLAPMGIPAVYWLRPADVLAWAEDDLKKDTDRPHRRLPIGLEYAWGRVKAAMQAQGVATADAHEVAGEQTDTPAPNGARTDEGAAATNDEQPRPNGTAQDDRVISQSALGILRVLEGAPAAMLFEDIAAATEGKHGLSDRKAVSRCVHQQLVPAGLATYKQRIGASITDAGKRVLKPKR